MDGVRRMKTGSIRGFAIVYGVPPGVLAGKERRFFVNIETGRPLCPGRAKLRGSLTIFRSEG